MKRSLVLSVYLLLLQVSVSANFRKDSLDILMPRPHHPAFAMPGGFFTVELRDAPGMSGKGWKAHLKNELKTWPVEVNKVERQRIHHGTEDGWVFTINVPANVAPELMALQLSHPSGMVAESARSVSIVPNFEQDFYIFHQSDEHITNDKAVEPGGKASIKWGNGSKEALIWLTPVLNLTNPRFVLHTGDNMQLYNNASDWCGMEEAKRRVKRFLEGLSGYTVPTLVATGNHDIGFSDYVQINEWRNEYQYVMGQRAFSVRMGSFYVLLSEWTSKDFQDWAKSDYEASFKDPTVKYRLLASHYYDGLSGHTTIAGADKPCDLLLCGHNHRTKTLQKDPYFALSVGTAQHHQRAAFFDFKRTASGWKTSQPAQHADDINVHKLVGDNGIPTVAVSYITENDGRASSNTAIINNTLPHDFYNGRVRFLMKKGRYKVNGGTILAQYDDEDRKMTAVLVKVNIVKNGQTKLYVAR